MHQNKRILAIIPARAGSKGVPGKNHLPIAGRPLVSWTFAAAKACPLLDEIICSTNDTLVGQAARKDGIEMVKRPARLAADKTPMLDVLLHVLAYVERQGKRFDYIVLLQPTSPLRTAADITRAVKLAVTNRANNLASITPVALRPGLLVVGTKQKTGVFSTVSLLKKQADVRRQEAPQLAVVNGAIYVYKRSFIRPGAKLNAPDVGLVLAQNHTLDIDTWQDVKRCEKALRKRQRVS